MTNAIILIIILDLYVLCLNVAQIVFLQNKEKETLNLKLQYLYEELNKLKQKN